MLKRSHILILLVIFLTGCGTLEAHESERVVGFIAGGDEQAEVLLAPASVEAGEAFDVTVTTFGPNGCWSEDGAEVEHEQGLITIMPYDIVERGGDTDCTDEFLHLERTVTLEADEPGEVTLRLQGRRLGDEASSVEVEQTVEVL